MKGREGRCRDNNKALGKVCNRGCATGATGAQRVSCVQQEVGNVCKACARCVQQQVCAGCARREQDACDTRLPTRPCYLPCHRNRRAHPKAACTALVTVVALTPLSTTSRGAAAHPTPPPCSPRPPKASPTLQRTSPTPIAVWAHLRLLRLGVVCRGMEFGGSQGRLRPPLTDREEGPLGAFALGQGGRVQREAPAAAATEVVLRGREGQREALAAALAAAEGGEGQRGRGRPWHARLRGQAERRLRQSRLLPLRRRCPSMTSCSGCAG